MAEGKITIPPPIGLLETDSYSAKANRVTSATSVTTTFEYTITHADGSQVIQIVQDTNGDRDGWEISIDPLVFSRVRGAGREPGACWRDWPRPAARLLRVHKRVAAA